MIWVILFILLLPTLWALVDLMFVVIVLAISGVRDAWDGFWDRRWRSSQERQYLRDRRLRAWRIYCCCDHGIDLREPCGDCAGRWHERQQSTQWEG